MSQNASSIGLTENQSKRSGLPRYYLITALVVLMILVLGFGGIYYRLAPEAILERANRENVQFAEEIGTLAERAATLSRISPELVDQVEKEMADRPVLKVRVYGDRRVRYSTDPSEVGDRITDFSYYWSSNNDEGTLEHYPTFDTGTETLLERYVVVSKLRVGEYRDEAGIEIYTDVTEERNRAFRLVPWIVGGIEAALAIALVFTLVRRG